MAVSDAPPPGNYGFLILMANMDFGPNVCGQPAHWAGYYIGRLNANGHRDSPYAAELAAECFATAPALRASDEVEHLLGTKAKLKWLTGNDSAIRRTRRDAGVRPGSAGKEPERLIEMWQLRLFGTGFLNGVSNFAGPLAKVLGENVEAMFRLREATGGKLKIRKEGLLGRRGAPEKFGDQGEVPMRKRRHDYEGAYRDFQWGLKNSLPNCVPHPERGSIRNSYECGECEEVMVGKKGPQESYGAFFLAEESYLVPGVWGSFSSWF